MAAREGGAFGTDELSISTDERLPHVVGWRPVEAWGSKRVASLHDPRRSARSKRLTREERQRLGELQGKRWSWHSPGHGDAVIMGSRTPLRTVPWL